MMEITKERLIEIIKEEYQTILNEKTVRMGDMDIIFQGSDRVQLIGRKGRTALSKMDAKIIISAIRRHIGGI
tara:strand:- start:271 stop:486 length:216 start_codon:yes stop_codon:yes gene_type:complete